MNLFIKTIVASLALTSISMTGYAQATKPGHCPDAAKIRTAGLSYTEKDQGMYIDFQINNYGTNNTWAFAIGEFQASSQQNALSKGYNALAGLSGHPNPQYMSSDDTWACIYHTSAGYLAVAVSPIPMSKKINRAMMLPAQ